MAQKKKTKKAAPKQRKTAQPQVRKPRGVRVPAGAVIERTYKGKTLKVTATDEGFRFQGKTWPSLTAIALHVTGAKAISGPFFFGLTQRRAQGKK